MKKLLFVSFYSLIITLYSCGSGNDSQKTKEESAPSEEMNMEESSSTAIDSAMAAPEPAASEKDITVNEEGVK